tara:strand:- start:461 stop:1972 length:1512 start_codon:yes stop_codon:yes gene_type:complete
MKHHLQILFIFLLLGTNVALGQTQHEKSRTIVTTDGEIDDVDSFIRMLLYANEFTIEGLVYSSSMWHYKGDGKGTTMVSEMEMTQKIYGEKTDLRWPGIQWMQGLIDAYELVEPNLSLHAKGYPTAAHLRTLIKVGNIDFEGEMEKDTEGSNFIRTKLLDDDMSPLYLQVWGGTNTISRALKSIEEAYSDTPEWDAIQKKVVAKTIIYTILDQDATYKKYISKQWPDIRIFYNSKQFWCLAYPWKTAVDPVLHPYLEGEFMGGKIINGHGPLTKMYYSYGDGQKQDGDDEHIHGDLSKIKNGQWGTFHKYDFISEGDSPAFLHLIDVGLDNLDHPDFGGWGGRLQQSETSPNRWEDGEDVADLNPISGKMDLAYPQIRWLKTLQLDFAARADWCVKTYKEANHPPSVTLKHAHNIPVKAGQKVILHGKATDPDGDALQYYWWRYDEVDTFEGKVQVSKPMKAKTFLTVPEAIKKGETIHFILEVTDSRSPSMTRYQRVVLTAQ